MCVRWGLSGATSERIAALSCPAHQRYEEESQKFVHRLSVAFLLDVQLPQSVPRLPTHESSSGARRHASDPPSLLAKGYPAMNVINCEQHLIIILSCRSTIIYLGSFALWSRISIGPSRSKHNLHCKQRTDVQRGRAVEYNLCSRLLQVILPIRTP